MLRQSARRQYSARDDPEARQNSTGGEKPSRCACCTCYHETSPPVSPTTSASSQLSWSITTSPSLYSSSSSSCYSLDDSLTWASESKAPSGLRPNAKSSQPGLRPPPKLHNRPFKTPEAVRPSLKKRNFTHPHYEWDSHAHRLEQEYPQAAMPQTEDCISTLSLDRSLNERRFTSTAVNEQFRSISRWSESTFGGHEPSEDIETSDSEYETAKSEYADSESDITHFTLLEAHRLSIHTWVLNPYTVEAPGTSKSASVPQGKLENTVDPSFRNRVKRWGIIF
ncbi:hypothetical protein DER45DRAFT_540101 [Fusarium avenaceum]|nr:hypothetical protein DER45DRAFT_540101 [Fusarium avenaceum]